MKLLKLRRADSCATCAAALPAGTEAYWFAVEKVVRCCACVDRPSDPPPTTSLGGGAGRSARDQYERRSAREQARKEKVVADDAEWRRTLREQKPVVGRIVTTFTPKPTVGPESQSTSAWKVGAEGEERVAEVLDPVPGIEVLHDRRVPGSQANIDHLAVGPRGVFVIDAKKYKEGSLIEVRDKGGLLRSDLRLFVGGRDRTKLVDGVRSRMDVVRTALGDEFELLPVHGVLCFVGCTWGWRMRPKTVKGVTAIWPKGLPDLVAGPGDHAASIATATAHLAAVLRPAGRG